MLKKATLIGTAIVTLASAGAMTKSKEFDCLGKDYQYEMNVSDHDKSEVVSICDNETEYNARKTSIIKSIEENKTRAKEGVSPSVYAVLISANDEKFRDDVASELLKKYNHSEKAFIGDKLDYDFREQRQLYFYLASIKCSPNCPLAGDNPNEWAYNILTK